MTRIVLHANQLVVYINFVRGEDGIELGTHPDGDTVVLVLGTPDELREIGEAFLSLAATLDDQ